MVSGFRAKMENWMVESGFRTGMVDRGSLASAGASLFVEDFGKRLYLLPGFPSGFNLLLEESCSR